MSQQFARVDVKELIQAGVHFGHKASRWHPCMKPYIFGKRNQIHIIDLRETVKGILRATHFLSRLVASGRDVVFVGTKRPAKTVVENEAKRAQQHWVVERWLGGTLTNYHTIRERLKRLEILEELETTGEIERYSKKRVSSLRRERRKITRNLEGLRAMKKLPGCLVVVDIGKEHIAVSEAKKMGIPVVGLVDTDCDPSVVDICIPCNDDAYRSIQVIVQQIAEAIAAGRDKAEARYQAEAKAAMDDAGGSGDDAPADAASKDAASKDAASKGGASKGGDASKEGGAGNGVPAPSTETPRADTPGKADAVSATST